MTPLEWKFRGGGWGVESEEPSVGGGGMDIFWNHTFVDTQPPALL